MYRLRFIPLALVCALVACSSSPAEPRIPTPSPEPRSSDNPAVEGTPGTPTPIPAVDEARPNADILAGLTDLIVPIDSIHPVSNTEDLDAIHDLTGDAEVVGLGESTHGTSEFITIRHRIVQVLVEDMGFRYIALEAPWAGIEIVNHYVQNDLNDEDAARDGLSYFMFRNEEFWELVTWIRDHNLSVDPADSVHLVGVDPQGHSAEASRIVLDFINLVDTTHFDEFAALYKEIEEGSPSGHYLPQSRDAYESLESRRSQYVAESSDEDYEHALHAARVVYQSRQLLSTSADDHNEAYRLREEFMAENVEWARQRAPAGAKTVVWAHNLHISKENHPTLNDVRSLGGHLHDRHDERYVTVGFDFARGSFTARSDAELSAPPTTFTIESSPEHTYAHLFAQLEPDAFTLVLQDIDATNPAVAYLSTPRTMWTIGCCYSPQQEQFMLGEVDITKAYDALIFVEHTTATTILNGRSP